MRFLKVTTFYDVYLTQFYTRHPSLASLPFSEQRSKLYWDCFGWADFFQHALEPLGYDAHELVMNAEPLQRMWAAEHGAPFPETDWMLQLAFEQIRRLDPEILFLDDTPIFPLAWIERVRSSCPSMRLVIGWSGAPSANRDALGAYDAVLSCVPELVGELQAGGHRGFHLHHGFDPRVLQRIDADRPAALDLSFVGQIVASAEFHAERQRMLLGLSDAFDIRIHSPGNRESLRERIKRKVKPLLRPAVELVDRAPLPRRVRNAIPLPKVASGAYDRKGELPRALSRRIRPPLFGLEMFQLLHDSRATFNCHIGASRRSASNMRLFEATGVGTCLVTDLKDNLHELFVPDEEVVTYSSLPECIEKVGWLMNNPSRAREIAARGKARTLRDHTYASRAVKLDEITRGLLA
jgi:spore maturation protein CgeB